MSSIRTFSFDIGTNSIGWCVLGNNGSVEPGQIMAAGVRIFSDGREPKSGNSLAEGRRMARGMSRRRERYKRRRKAVLRTLSEYGLMPPDTAGRQALLQETRDRSPKAEEAVLTDVYSLRARALNEKLPLHHIGRAIFHLDQRRGFKSNRKTDKRSNDKGAIELGENRLLSKMSEAQSRTLGEYLAMRRAAGEWVRVRSGAFGEDATEEGARAPKTIYDFYPVRKMLEDEFDAIWAAQQAHHPEVLTEERRAHLFRVIFHQRPLKAAIIGRCVFNQTETRLAKTHPLFQEFRLYKEVNELEIVLPDQEHRKLTLDERNTLIKTLRVRRKMTYKSMRSALKLPGDETFNKESDARVHMAGDEIHSALVDKKAFGNRWADMSLDDQWAIVQRLRDEEDSIALHEWLVFEQGLSDDAAETVAKIHLPDGYGRLGPTALETMLDELKADVIPEAEAAKRAGYDHSLAREAGEEALKRLPKYQEVLERRIPPGTNDPEDPYDIAKGRITNPTVHIALNQLRRVVNALIRRYGRPDTIAVELARDLKLNDRQKDDVNREIAKNTRAAEKRSEKLREIGQKDNGYNRALLKLWEELNPDNPEDRVCIYTGRPISIRMLFSGAVDVDHILPWSKTLDDSQGNRILCLVEANRTKGNRAPADVNEWAGDYDAILDRANRLPRNKRWRFARDAMDKFEADRDFLARQLTDTQYLSRMAHEYLASLYPAEEADAHGELRRRNRVRVIPGRLTEMLRRQWGLNSILPDHNFAGTGKAKNRLDHRHHAIDAAVVGVTTRSLLQKISTEAGQREAMAVEETVAKIDPPWPTFRDDLKAVVDRIVVSHKPDHGTLPNGSGAKGQTAGRLHNDTAYGITGQTTPGGNTIVVRRKPFLALTEKDVPTIRDEELRARLFSATSGLSGNEFKAALEHFRRTDTKFMGLRRVRVTETLSVIPIHDANGRPYKAYKGDANFRYDVWEMPDGKWVADVVSMYDAHRPDYSADARKPHPAARRILSLKRNDMVAYDHPSDGPTIGIVVKFRQDGVATLATHREAGNLKNRDATGDDPFKYFQRSPSGLKAANLRQIRVDEIGHVLDPGPQDRESRRVRSSPKHD